MLASYITYIFIPQLKPNTIFLQCLYLFLKAPYFQSARRAALLFTVQAALGLSDRIRVVGPAFVCLELTNANEAMWHLLWRDSGNHPLSPSGF